MMLQSSTPTWVSLTIPQLPMIITSLGTFIVAVAGIRKLTKGQSDAAVTASEVKETLVATHQTTEKKIDAIHTLVNSEHSVSLRLAANFAARIAKLTHDAGDIQAAEDTKRAADEHDQKQHSIDTNTSPPSP
jgi:hypothetical protein